VRGTLSRARAAWRGLLAESDMIVASVARASRLRAIAAGLRPREVAVVNAGGGRFASGLFSEFASVLGFLDHYDHRRDEYAGVAVEFRDGLYLDPAVGPNWWNYYFQPIAIGGGAPIRPIGHAYHDLCARRVEVDMPRERGADLIAKFIAPSAPVEELIGDFIRSHWRNDMIGVHYRGTDKRVDAPRVAYAEVETVVRQHLVPDSGQVFVATDEQSFVDFMAQCFPGRVLFRPMFRSTDGRPIDIVNADGNYQKGLDAVVDCLLLSKTRTLIRTASNLGLCATFFNPVLPQILLSRER
jgi:hypothetical protein